MSDLIERLRDQGHLMQRDGLTAMLHTATEAADQLEAQQAEIARLREALAGALAVIDAAGIVWGAHDKARAALEKKP